MCFPHPRLISILDDHLHAFISSFVFLCPTFMCVCLCLYVCMSISTYVCMLENNIFVYICQYIFMYIVDIFICPFICFIQIFKIYLFIHVIESCGNSYCCYYCLILLPPFYSTSNYHCYCLFLYYDHNFNYYFFSSTPTTL